MKTTPSNPALYPRFRTKAGRLTRYAFACGYVAEKNEGGISTTIWQDGGCNFYQIRRHDHNTGKRIFWEDSRTIAGAYKIFNRKLKYNMKNLIPTYTVIENNNDGDIISLTTFTYDKEGQNAVIEYFESRANELGNNIDIEYNFAPINIDPIAHLCFDESEINLIMVVSNKHIHF